MRQVVHIETTRLNIAHSTYAMAEWLRRWTRNSMGSSRVGLTPASSETFLCQKKQLSKESNASSGSHWNDEVEHSALNLIAPAAMAEWLRRWTRNPMGSSRAGSIPARSEIFFVLKKEIQLWKESHASSDSIETMRLNIAHSTQLHQMWWPSG